MHEIEIRLEIIERVMARRGRLHLFENLAPAKTALIVIDMQNTFLRPGAPVEVPKGREIVANINRLSARLREIGVLVVWVTHANSSSGGKNDWPGFFDHFVAAEVRQKTIDGLAPGADGQKIWPELDVAPETHRFSKTATARLFRARRRSRACCSARVSTRC